MADCPQALSGCSAAKICRCHLTPFPTARSRAARISKRIDRRERTPALCCLNTSLEALLGLGQIVWRPVYEVILLYVEMNLWQFAFPNHPDYVLAEAESEPGFKIGSSTLPREVGNHKLRATD